MVVSDMVLSISWLELAVWEMYAVAVIGLVVMAVCVGRVIAAGEGAFVPSLVELGAREVGFGF